MSTPPTSDLPTATISEQDGVRYLHLDTPWVQGAMLLKQPRTLVPEVVRLPSTSPANASWSLQRKLDAWRAVFVQHGLCA